MVCVDKELTFCLLYGYIIILLLLLFLFCKVSLCLRPSDVLLVTYNHMDAIRGFACDNPAISSQVENVYKLLYEVS